MLPCGIAVWGHTIGEERIKAFDKIHVDFMDACPQVAARNDGAQAIERQFFFVAVIRFSMRCNYQQHTNKLIAIGLQAILVACDKQPEEHEKNHDECGCISENCNKKE